MTTLTTTTHLSQPTASARVWVANGTTHLNPTDDRSPLLGLYISHDVGGLSAVLRAWADLVDRAEAEARIVEVAA